MSDDYIAIIEKCRKSELSTIKLDVNGRHIYIHSKYDPMSEAEKQVEKLTVGPGANYIIFGLGLGYHLRALLKRLDKDDYNKIAVFEPNKQVLEMFLNDEKNKDLLEDPRIRISYYVTVHKAGELVNQLYKESTAYLNNFLVFLPIYKDIYTAKCRDFAAYIKSMVLSCFLSINTSFLFAEKWFRCTLDNADFLRKSYSGKKLRSMFENIPAIIVSAGPSLSKNIELLSELYDKAVIISVDTASRPLYTRGIEAHFYVTIDAQAKVLNKFQGTNALEKDLIACFTSAPEVLNAHTGRKIAYASFNIFIDACFDDLGIEPLYLESGGSVACTALDVAYKIGADPIIFVGQDLAYTDQKTHIEGTAFFQSGELVMGVDVDMEVLDIYGNMVPTTINLNQYREWMEMFIHMFPDRNYIDATEGGAKIAGTEILTLKEVVETYCVESYNISERKEQVFTADNLSATKDQYTGYIGHIENAGNYLKKILPEIKACNKNCEKMIKEIDTNGFKRPKLIVNPYKRIRKLNNALDRNEHHLDIILPLISLYRDDATRTDHLRDKDLTEEKKIVMDLEKYRDYYKALIEKITYAVPLIEESVTKNMEAINNE